MPLALKLTMTSLASFFVTSLNTVLYRTIIFELGCDPKFKCLCSFSCLFTPIIICTLIFGFAFILAYWLIGKGHFMQINKVQFKILAVFSGLLGLLVFGYPLATIIIIYGGYFIIWLPISFVFSIALIQLLKRYNK